MLAYAGELAALGTAFCWSATAVLFSYSGRRVGSDVVNRTRLLFAFLFLLVSHTVVEGQLFPLDAAPFRWFWLSISSILGLVLGDTFLFRAFVLLGPRLSTLLMATVPIYSTFLGWLLFQETASPRELAGMALAIGGIAWVVTEKQAHRSIVEHKNYRAGILYGLAGALGQVANLVTARYGLVGDYSTVSATLLRITVALVVLWGVTALRSQIGASVKLLRNRQTLLAIGGGAFTGPFLGIWLSLVAIQLAPLGIASTLMALPPILLIPAEYVLYRRPVSRRATLGTAVALIGVALIFLQPQSAGV